MYICLQYDTRENMFKSFRRKMPNSKNQGFIVAEFYDGIQVIPKSWLQSNDVCKYPSHYKTDLKIRKAIEKEEIPTSNWSSVKIDRIFASLCKADEKAKQALDTSDMDTDKEARSKEARKLRAKKAMLSSESEEESSREIILPRPPRPPAKRQRSYDENESGILSTIKCSRNSSAETYSKSEKVSNSNEHESRDHNSSYSRNEERHNSTVHHRLENEEDISNRHVDKMDEIGHMQDEERLQEKRNDNLDKSSQDAIVDHLKRLTREIATIKYDMRQTLSLLDILVKRTNSETEAKNTEISFESVEDRFPLQTAEQLMEVEEILKLHNSQDNAAIVS
ncbi:eukaryotic translation initiation factor 5B-like [Solenopsis invicta]|uniref:eukaryotic translation initiation factor 5B-like n=1 Tax=Solenopsis invicta TaxID=13686 RepID=UPI00193E56B8|nr:eukaryotic translation initiation factor 5B-like [Solenopsis invicta]